MENDVNQKLAGLIENRKVRPYFGAIPCFLGKTAAEIRREYEEESRRNWQLELVLAKIADEEKITVSDEEINQFIAKTPQSDQKALEQQRYLIAAMLRQQKTLNFLKNL